jgi:hypothetical protein
MNGNKEKKGENISGEICPKIIAYRTPAIEAKLHENVNPNILIIVGFMPIAFAAISSSLTAFTFKPKYAFEILHIIKYEREKKAIEKKYIRSKSSEYTLNPSSPPLPSITIWCAKYQKNTERIKLAKGKKLFPNIDKGNNKKAVKGDKNKREGLIANR